jgi:N-acetyl-anhydromuramyl-L-alanine amidase AmpD
MQIIELNEFKGQGTHKKIKQIVLFNSKRVIENYFASLKYRSLKEKKIPNFVVTRKGEVYQTLKDGDYSNFFNNNFDKEVITICLENLGWLEKVPLESFHINWCGDIYNGEVFSRKWRDYFMWQPYTEIQIEKCSELCNLLLEKFSIDKNIIGHNTQVDFIENFRGISTRSNFEKNSTDVSPSFDFEIFSKKIKNA